MIGRTVIILKVKVRVMYISTAGISKMVTEQTLLLLVADIRYNNTEL